MGLVSGAREVNKIMFPNENTKYIFSLLQQAQEFFTCKDAPIVLDDNTHAIKKKFFKHTKNDTLSNLVSKYNVDLLTQNKDKMQISYKDYKGILTYNIGNVSVIGNDFLNANPDFDFFMDVTSKKRLVFVQMVKWMSAKSPHKSAMAEDITMQVVDFSATSKMLSSMIISRIKS